MDPMNNVKGQKIHLGDSLLDEVGTQVGLPSKRIAWCLSILISVVIA